MKESNGVLQNRAAGLENAFFYETAGIEVLLCAE
jgi:hypothetical protein